MAYKFKYTSSNLTDKVVSYTAKAHLKLSTIKYFRYYKDTNKLEVLYSTLKSPLNTLYPTLCGLPISSLSEGIDLGDLDVRGRNIKYTSRFTGSNYRNLPLTVLPHSYIISI